MYWINDLSPAFLNRKHKQLVHHVDKHIRDQLCNNQPCSHTYWNSFYFPSLYITTLNNYVCSLPPLADVTSMLFFFDIPSCARTHIFGNIYLWNTGRIVTGVLQSIETITHTWSVSTWHQSALFKSKTFSYRMVVLE